MSSSSLPFEEGELVRLKGGGPVMSVLLVGSDETVYCLWLDAEGKMHEMTFQASLLERVEQNHRY